MSNIKTFEIGGVTFSAVRHQTPRPHWRLKLEETGVTLDPGTGGISNESVPKMQSDVQQLLDRVSKGDIADFRRRFGLPTFLLHENTKVYFDVSPCSWMNKGYGLQIQMSLMTHAVNAASIFDIDKSIAAEAEPRHQLDTLAELQARRWLHANGLEPLRAAAQDWIRAKQKFSADAEVRAKQQSVADKKRFSKAMAKGFTHLLTAWIHPESGDDYQIEVLSKGDLTKQDIAKCLAKSEVKTDYQVQSLADLLK